MFNNLVASTLLHGAACWGPFNHHTDASTLQLGFLKRILHVPPSTDSWALLTECDYCLPIDITITQRIHSLWNRLSNSLSRNPNRLLSQAFKENIQLLRNNINCWSKHASLRLIAFDSNFSAASFLTDAPLHQISDLADQVNITALLSSLSDAPSDSRDLYLHTSFQHAVNDRRRTYARWFWIDHQALLEREPSA